MRSGNGTTWFKTIQAAIRSARSKFNRLLLSLSRALVQIRSTQIYHFRLWSQTRLTRPLQIQQVELIKFGSNVGNIS